MKLNDTLLCLNCDVLFERHERQCPFCASSNHFPIAPWLNRERMDTILLICSSSNSGETIRTDTIRYKARGNSSC